MPSPAFFRSVSSLQLLAAHFFVQDQTSVYVIAIVTHIKGLIPFFIKPNT